MVLQLLPNQHLIRIRLFVVVTRQEQPRLVDRQRAILSAVLRQRDKAALFVGLGTPSSQGVFLVVRYLQCPLSSEAGWQPWKRTEQQLDERWLLATTIHAPQVIHPRPPALASGTSGIVINHFSTKNVVEQRHLADLLTQKTQQVMQWQPGFQSANLHVGLDTPGMVNVAQWESPEAIEAMMKNPLAKEGMKQIERDYPRIGDVFVLTCLIDGRSWSDCTPMTVPLRKRTHSPSVQPDGLDGLFP